MVRACCPNVLKLENIVSSVSLCFQDTNYAYATRQGILTKIRACEQLQKFYEHEQASTHQILRAIRAKAKFCEHFQIRWGHSIPLQSRTKVVGTLEPDHVSPILPNQCWKISRFFQQKEKKNYPIINIVSGGRGELARCPNLFVRDCRFLWTRHPDGLQHGDRKSTETSITEFC